MDFRSSKIHAVDQVGGVIDETIFCWTTIFFKVRGISVLHDNLTTRLDMSKCTFNGDYLLSKGVPSVVQKYIDITNLLKKVFPKKELVELPKDHEIFNSYFNFPDGLPKVHEHDNKPPQAFALFDKERMILLYTYESDLGDGWEDQSVHQNPLIVRENALKMGVNIIYFALSQ